MSDRLLVIFAPGLWPFRSQLDGVCWVLTQGMAAGLSLVPGLVAYATPRALVEPEPAVKLLRSLPPDDVVRTECRTLGARWALTWRVLEDRHGLEVWLNLVDGETGSLLWTKRQTSDRQRLVWVLTRAIRRLVRRLGLSGGDVIEGRLIAPTMSFGALSAWVRARTAQALWQGDKEGGFDIVRDAARAAALDHAFVEAIELMVEVAEPLIEALDDPRDVERLRASIVADRSLEAARRLRQTAHERLLALAKHPRQT